jgi:hypothetical protein
MIATHTATVEVRVPRDGPDSLVDAARRRLEAAVDRVEVVGARGVEPGLSATVVTVEVLVDGDPDRLGEAPGVQRVDGVERS